MKRLKRYFCQISDIGAAGAACLTFACSAIAFEATASERLAEAQSGTIRGPFRNASSLYSKLVEEQPEQSEAWYGLVQGRNSGPPFRQSIRGGRTGFGKAPATAGAETAAGLAMFRHGNLSKAELHFRTALAIKPDYPGALRGLASIYFAVSKPKTARDLLLRAYRQSPDDPGLMVAYANTLKGSEHIAALEAALAKIDPASEQARNLRVHIANDRAIGDRKLRPAG